MARQKGPVKFTGRIDNLSFYESNNEYLVKSIGGGTREQVLGKDNFERTRENAGEFGSSSTTGKLIRNAITAAGADMDNTAYYRLNKRLLQAKGSDQTSTRGNRRADKGELSILERFEFLQEARLSDNFFVRYEAAIDHGTGTCTVTIPPFLPGNCIEFPRHARRVRLIALAVEPDLENDTARHVLTASEALRPADRLTDPITLTCSFEGSTELPLILMLGLQFMDEYQGFCFPLREKEFNSLAIVRAETGPAGA